MIITFIVRKSVEIPLKISSQYYLSLTFLTFSIRLSVEELEQKKEFHLKFILDLLLVHKKFNEIFSKDFPKKYSQ